EWAEANGAVEPSDASGKRESYANFNANGTGPFIIVSHEVGVKTVVKPNPTWWDTPKHNITEGIFTPIGSDATRVAALLSGDLDMVYPVPVQDIKRVDANPGTSTLTGPELRTIFLGFDSMRDELLESSVKGKNPFKDLRVRQAFYKAINIEAIRKKVMRGLATPAALMISPFMFPLADQFKRLDYDVAAAKDLMKQAGYENGFEVGLDCPNNRYVNDEAICQAVAAMLSKIGVKINLLAQPKSKYFAKVLQSGGYQTSFYLLGWTPGSFDSWNVLSNLLGCRDASGKGGPFNLGGYCNPKVDALTAQVLGENDAKKRDLLIRDAYRITTDEVAYIPLHQQGLAWGKSDKVDLKQRADNQFMLYYVNIK
ncbi:MAG: ABC transporter substrate-binding protein, partial [Hyphomicrobiales bacterium]